MGKAEGPCDEFLLNSVSLRGCEVSGVIMTVLVWWGEGGRGNKAPPCLIQGFLTSDVRNY